MSHASSNFDALPDFLGRLEHQLARAAAIQTPRRGALASRWGRPILAAPVALAATVALAIILWPFGNSTPSAYGNPAILQTPATPVPAPLRGGLALEIAAGPDAALDEARAIPAFGSTTYLLSGDDAWCLSAPDPGADRPDVERGVTCTDTAEFLRIGVALIVGNRYIAAIPEGVRPPASTRGDGQRKELQPNKQGVVAVSLAAGETVTRYDIDGGTRTDSGR